MKKLKINKQLAQNLNETIHFLENTDTGLELLETYSTEQIVKNSLLPVLEENINCFSKKSYKLLLVAAAMLLLKDPDFVKHLRTIQKQTPSTEIDQ